MRVDVFVHVISLKEHEICSFLFGSGPALATQEEMATHRLARSRPAAADFRRLNRVLGVGGTKGTTMNRCGMCCVQVLKKELYFVIVFIDNCLAVKQTIKTFITGVGVMQ